MPRIIRLDSNENGPTVRLGQTSLPAQGIAQLAGGGQSPPRTPQQKSELTWSGEIPSQKWMNFYTKFLTKLGVGNGLTLTVKVESRPEGGLSPQRLEEIRSALRELGLDDRIH